MNNVEISKELLLEIMPLDENTEWEDYYQTKINNSLSVGYSYSLLYKGKIVGCGANHINIYEFASKCKKWANTKGYIIIDFIDENNDEFWSCRIYRNGLNDGYEEEIAYCMEDYNAIINACEWILNNEKS